MCLLGTGSLATALEVNHLTLMADCNLVTPTIDALRECTTATEVAEIEAPNENGLVTYPGSATFLPAPWLAEAVIAANSSDPFLLITIVNAAATAFDEEHEEDEDYVTTAEDHAGDFLLWSWAVGAGRVSATSCIFDPTDIDLECFRVERHQACIIPSGGVTWAAIPGGLPPPPAADITNTAVLGLLNTTLSRQADKQDEQNTILTNQLQHMIEKEGLIKNRFKNLHESITKMIIFASAVDNEDTPDEPVESFKRIINSKTVALAEQELNTQFESHGLSEVSFSQGYMANIYSGNLLWSSSDSPSNHSPFSLAEVEPLRADEQKIRHITLQLVLTQGRGMTVDEIKASNKQEVHPPMNFHELKEQLNMFLVATKIFFGELSIGSQCFGVLLNMINHHKSTFKAKERLDEQFAAKFLFAVDTRNQLWLKECKSAKNNRDEVDDSIIDFCSLISQVVLGSFHILLPPTFQMKNPNETKTGPPGGGDKRKGLDENKRGSDRKKGRENAKNHAVVKNLFPHGEICMLANKTWAGDFAGKCNDARPKWNEKCKCCPRWFLQKYCFSDCPNKESHVLADRIPPPILQQMLAWVKACRK